MTTITALGIGSGMDFNGLLDQLSAAERQKLAPLNQQKQQARTKISAYGQLQGGLSQLQVATSRISAASLYASVRSDISGNGVSVAAGPGAMTGSYQLDVRQLARAYSIATEGVIDKDANLGATTVAITIGNEAPLSLEFDQDNSSLVNIRDAINAANAGINASIVHDGGAQPFRLVLTSSKTGSEAAITDIDFGGLGAQLALDHDTEVSARDALLEINGILVTSAGNQVEGALEGITFVLKSEGPASLVVSRDDQVIRGAIKDFVTAYNSLRGSMTRMNAYDAASGTAGELMGDAALRGIQSSLRQVLNDTVGEGAYRRLSDIGITMQLDGSLKLDEKRLSDVITQTPGGVATLLSGADGHEGFADRLMQRLERMLAEDGTISIATKGLDTSLKQLDQRQQRLQTGIDSTIARYRRQFAQLDSMIANMNSTSNYLAQQFDMMNAQLGRNR